MTAPIRQAHAILIAAVLALLCALSAHAQSITAQPVSTQ